METLNKCLLSLKKASCDSEKLAILHVIAKVAPNLQLDLSYVNNLFDAISAEFILRLLKSNESEDSQRYICIAVRICSILFQNNCHLVNSNASILFAIFNIVHQLKNEVLSETLELLLSISNIPECSKLLVDAECFTYLGKFVKEDKESNLVMSLFGKVLKATNNFPDDADMFMCELTALFASSQDLKKFYYMHVLDEFVQYLDHFELDYMKRPFIVFEDFIKGCREILQSRVKEEFKKNTLSLLLNFTNTFGAEFLFDSRNNCDEKFVALVLTVTALELNFTNNQSFNVVNKNITIACQLTHNLLLAIFSDCFENSQFASNVEFIKNLLCSLNNVISAVFFYLKQIKLEDLDSAQCSTMQAASSLICIWATEDTSNLRSDLVETQPIIFEVVKICFKSLTVENTQGAKLVDLFVLYILQNIQNTKLKLFQRKYFIFVVDYLQHMLSENILNLQSIEFSLHLLNVYTLVFPKLLAKYKDFNCFYQLLLLLLNKEQFLLFSELSYCSKVEAVSIAIFVLGLLDDKNEFLEKTYKLAFNILCLKNEKIVDNWIILLQRLIEFSPKSLMLKVLMCSHRDLLSEKLNSVANAEDVLASLKDFCS